MKSAEEILDDAQGHSLRWGALARADRLRLMRALRRGEPMEDRTEAAIVVQEARRQLRYWRWVWLFGPASAVLQLDQGLAAFLGAALAGTAVTGGLAIWQVRRARRAEAVNLAVATGEAARREAQERKQARQEHQQANPNLGPRRDGRPDPNTSKAKRRRRRR